MADKNNPKAAVEFKRQMRSISLILLVSVLCSAVSMVQWFSGAQDYSLLAPKLGYSASVQAVQATTLPYSGDNLLWCDREITYCDTLIDIPSTSTSVSFVVSNLSTSDLGMEYAYRLSYDGVMMAKDDWDNLPLAPGESETFAIAVDPARYKSVRLQVFTAPAGNRLAPFDRTPLENFNGTLYLCDDFDWTAYSQQTGMDALTFKNVSGNVCLAGHTLTVPDMKVIADAGVYGVLAFSDGTLIVNDGAVTDQTSPLLCEGEGNILVQYSGLTKE